MTLSCTCSTFRISDAVPEHAEVFADRMRLPDAGIDLNDDKQRLRAFTCSSVVSCHT